MDIIVVASHDDVIKWKHFPRNWPFVRGIHRSRWIPHTKASDAELWCFFFICVWINGWINKREAGDLRCYRAHSDVIVMKSHGILRPSVHNSWYFGSGAGNGKKASEPKLWHSLLTYECATRAPFQYISSTLVLTVSIGVVFILSIW